MNRFLWHSGLMGIKVNVPTALLTEITQHETHPHKCSISESRFRSNSELRVDTKSCIFILPLYPNTRWPCIKDYSPPPQSKIFTKIPTQKMSNFVHNYKETPIFHIIHYKKLLYSAKHSNCVSCQSNVSSIAHEFQIKLFSDIQQIGPHISNWSCQDPQMYLKHKYKLRSVTMINPPGLVHQHHTVPNTAGFQMVWTMPHWSGSGATQPVHLKLL